jgi:hypothetical protein
MDVVIVGVAKPFHSNKTNKDYVTVNMLCEDGTVIPQLFAKEDYDAMSVPKGAIATEEQLKDIFEALPVTDVQYDNRGRVKKIEVA